MPWTIDDVEQFHSGLTQEQKQQWVAVANEVYERCMSDGGSDEDCAATAVRQANGVVKDNQCSPSSHLHTLRASRNGQIRTVTHDGESHLVVPVVLLTEGVHCGSAGALYYPAEELSLAPYIWNGRPVCIQHPQTVDGIPTTCNDPEIIEKQTVGYLYHVEYRDGKLVGELWLNERKLRRFPEVINALERGRLEVSTGLFSDDELVSGVWNGEEYSAIVRHIQPDHLALLPGATGACSWEDGCGAPRFNSSEKEVTVPDKQGTVPTPIFSGCTSDEWKPPILNDYVSGYLTHHDGETVQKEISWEMMPEGVRKWIANLSIGGDAEAETFEKAVGHPVVDPVTLHLNENALRELSEKSDLDVGYKQVVNNLLEKEFGTPPKAEIKQGLFKTLVEKFKGFIGKAKSNELSFDDIRFALQRKIDGWDTPTTMHVVHEIFNDYFIMVAFPSDYSDGNVEPKLYKCSYAVDEDGGVVSVSDDLQEVRQEVSYKSVNNNQDNSDGGTNMPEQTKTTPCCPERVDALIGNENSPFKEEDKEWLLSLSAAQLDKIDVTVQNAVQEPKVEEPTVEEPKVEEPKVPDVQNESLDDREAREYGRQMYKAEKEKLVKKITDNSKAFTKEDLMARPFKDLEAMASLIKDPDYTAGGGVHGTQNRGAEEEEPLLPPVIDWKK